MARSVRSRSLPPGPRRATMRLMHLERRVVLVACDGLQSLDLTGPLEVLHAASRLAGGGSYAMEVVTPGGLPVRSSSGLRITPDGALEGVRGRIDTLVV